MALTHGYVVGELIYSRADDYETPDGDRLPDMLPATEVVLTFTPAARQFISPDNQLVVADPIPAAVMDDGQITGDVNVTRNPNGTIATVTPKTDATPGLWLVTGKYRVTAKGHYRDFDITVTEDHTEAAPLDLGTAVDYVPPTVTLQSVTIPPGATNGQVLGWDDGLAWIAPDSGGGGTDLTTYDQVSTLPDYPTVFPPDLTGVTAADVGALPASTTIPAEPGDIGAATAAQGAKADTAVQPAALESLATEQMLNDGLDTKAATGIPGLPAGSVIRTYWTGTAWPARPTARTDISVEWVGGTDAAPPTAGVVGVDTWMRETV